MMGLGKKFSLGVSPQSHKWHVNFLVLIIHWTNRIQLQSNWEGLNLFLASHKQTFWMFWLGFEPLVPMAGRSVLWSLFVGAFLDVKWILKWRKLWKVTFTWMPHTTVSSCVGGACVFNRGEGRRFKILFNLIDRTFGNNWQQFHRSNYDVIYLSLFSQVLLLVWAFMACWKWVSTTCCAQMLVLGKPVYHTSNRSVHVWGSMAESQINYKP